MSKQQQICHDASKAVVTVQAHLTLTDPQANIPVSITTDSSESPQSLFDTDALNVIQADKAEKQEKQRQLVEKLT